MYFIIVSIKNQLKAIVIDLRNHCDDDNNYWRDTVPCAEIVAKTLALLSMDCIYGLVVLGIVPACYDTTNYIIWNRALKLLHSLNGVIALINSTKSQKNIDSKLHKANNNPAPLLSIIVCEDPRD